jgi:predicted metal-dependent enzyme (double-stranded beta helix superfamily)
MKRKKLLQAIEDLLDQKKGKKLKRIDELKTLLAKLSVKRTELKERISLEKNKREKKRLSKELEAADAQHAKGLKQLRQLERS